MIMASIEELPTCAITGDDADMKNLLADIEDDIHHHWADMMNYQSGINQMSQADLQLTTMIEANNPIETVSTLPTKKAWSHDISKRGSGNA